MTTYALSMEAVSSSETWESSTTTHSIISHETVTAVKTWKFGWTSMLKRRFRTVSTSRVKTGRPYSAVSNCQLATRHDATVNPCVVTWAWYNNSQTWNYKDTRKCQSETYRPFCSFVKLMFSVLFDLFSVSLNRREIVSPLKWRCFGILKMIILSQLFVSKF
jgi:hypothetical protein